jgi:hypothetical protein
MNGSDRASVVLVHSPLAELGIPSAFLPYLVHALCEHRKGALKCRIEWHVNNSDRRGE